MRHRSKTLSIKPSCRLKDVMGVVIIRPPSVNQFTQSLYFYLPDCYSTMCSVCGNIIQGEFTCVTVGYC